MACVEVDDDEDFGPVWLCECGHWNDDTSDECYRCGLFWE